MKDAVKTDMVREILNSSNYSCLKLDYSDKYGCRNFRKENNVYREIIYVLYRKIYYA